jgi:hypothetical protein
MKLSEALEKGCAYVRQTKGIFLHVEDNEKSWGCALGAIAVGEFGLPTQDRVVELQIRLEQRHQELLDREVLLDVGPQITLLNAIMRLNDRHGKTFQQIKEWLERQDL